MPNSLTVRAIWDDAQVWVATSDDVPGLATEADDIDALVEKLKAMIPELLDANGVAHGVDVPFEVLGQRFAVAHREAAGASLSIPRSSPAIPRMPS